MGPLGLGALGTFPYTPLVWKHRWAGAGTTLRKQAASPVECEDPCLHWDGRGKEGELRTWPTA